MTDSEPWDDQARDNLREALRLNILGEVRLAKHGHDEILVGCREVYIEDDVPKPERDMFVQFASEEIERVSSLLAAEMATWPEITDCDRLDLVDDALRERGIMLWQASPCCDTCTCSELGDRADLLNDRYPGFCERLRGYAFFIDQNLPDQLAENTNLSICLGYGWVSPDGETVAPEIYETKALGIAREVCECLSVEGFEPDWDGSLKRKICIQLNWQRRSLLD